MIRRLAELWTGCPPGFWLVLAACAYFCWMAARLTVIDIRHHLLPNRIVFPSYAVAGGLLLGATVAWLLCRTGSNPSGQGDPNAPAAELFGVPGLQAVGAAATLYLFYFILRAIYPQGMGFGDVKLAGVLGLYLGYLGWAHVLVGTFAAFLFGGIWGMVIILARRGTLKSSIPFGPFMLAGAAVTMAVLPA